MQLIFGEIGGGGERERYMYNFPFLLPELAAPEKETEFRYGKMYELRLQAANLCRIFFFFLTRHLVFSSDFSGSWCVRKRRYAGMHIFEETGRLVLIIRVSASA